jgi:hypothetical protein
VRSVDLMPSIRGLDLKFGSQVIPNFTPAALTTGAHQEHLTVATAVSEIEVNSPYNVDELERRLVSNLGMSLDEYCNSRRLVFAVVVARVGLTTGDRIQSDEDAITPPDIQEICKGRTSGGEDRAKLLHSRYKDLGWLDPQQFRSHVTTPGGRKFIHNVSMAISERLRQASVSRFSENGNTRDIALKNPGRARSSSATETIDSARPESLTSEDYPLKKLRSRPAIQAPDAPNNGTPTQRSVVGPIHEKAGKDGTVVVKMHRPNINERGQKRKKGGDDAPKSSNEADKRIRMQPRARRVAGGTAKKDQRMPTVDAAGEQAVTSTNGYSVYEQVRLPAKIYLDKAADYHQAVPSTFKALITSWRLVCEVVKDGLYATETLFEGSSARSGYTDPLLEGKHIARFVVSKRLCHCVFSSDFPELHEQRAVMMRTGNLLSRCHHSIVAYHDNIKSYRFEHREKAGEAQKIKTQLTTALHESAIGLMPPEQALHGVILRALGLKSDLVGTLQTYQAVFFYPGARFNPDHMEAETRKGAPLPPGGCRTVQSLWSVSLCLWPALIVRKHAGPWMFHGITANGDLNRRNFTSTEGDAVDWTNWVVLSKAKVLLRGRDADS